VGVLSFFGKKGISPLIGVVLLIGFTVALAAMIITWGGGFLRGTQENVGKQVDVGLECARIDFKVLGVGCGDDISEYSCIDSQCSGGPFDGTGCTANDECSGHDLTRVRVLSNTGVEIKGFVIRATDYLGQVIVSDDIDDVLVPFGSVNAVFDEVDGLLRAENPTKVEMFAKVQVGNHPIEVCEVGSEKFNVPSSHDCRTQTPPP